MNPNCASCHKNLLNLPDAYSGDFVYKKNCCNGSYYFNKDTNQIIFYIISTEKYQITFNIQHEWTDICYIQGLHLLHFDKILNITPENADEKIKLYLTFS